MKPFGQEGVVVVPTKKHCSTRLFKEKQGFGPLGQTWRVLRWETHDTVGWVSLGKGGGGGCTLTTGHLNQLTCSESCLPLRKKPSRQPMTTASTDRMSSPFCLQTFFTRPHTSSRATAILRRLLHLLLLLLLLLSWSQRLLCKRPAERTPQQNPPACSFAAYSAIQWEITSGRDAGRWWTRLRGGREEMTGGKKFKETK